MILTISQHQFVRVKSSIFHTTSWVRCQYKCFSNARILFKNNIILMGSPGSGKTVIGRCLAAMTGRQVLDIDNDFLESHWGSTVAEKLESVGGSNFVEEEGKALLQLHPPDGAIISLTGSNPMHKESMTHIRSHGVTVFLDVKQSDILERLHKMKVNRIVGQEAGTPMSDILDYRQQFYEGSYDIRVICEEGESVDSIADKVHESLKQYKGRNIEEKEQSEEGYVSTRDVHDSRVEKDFNDVVLEGLANDGGLYIPALKCLPHFTVGQWNRLVQLPYEEKALRILEKWIKLSEVHPSKLGKLVRSVYSIENFDCHRVFPTVHLKDNIYLNELFHGPTASFKDAALQILPAFFEHAHKKQNSCVNIDNKDGERAKGSRYLFIVATSGDTGGAVLSGFQHLANNSDLVRIMVLYPEKGVSQVQKRQMKSFQGPGLKVLGVHSDFDFCQSTIKQIFNDDNIINILKENYNVKLSAANSINWGRLLPQVVYHAGSYLDLVKQEVITMGEPVDLCVPTGNFGNILAAYYAKEMGVPFRRLICASNVNNVLTDFFKTGNYDLTNRKLHVTASPAIDILRSSNLERFIYHISGGDAKLVNSLYSQLHTCHKFSISSQLLHKLQSVVTADWCDESSSSQQICDTFRETGYLLDPHTAVALSVAERYNKLSNHSNRCPIVIASTAHYAKFANDVLQSVVQDTERETMRDVVNSENSNIKDTKQFHLHEDYSNIAPEVLFKELSELNDLKAPGIHRALWKCVSKPVSHDTVVKAEVNNIVEELYKFVEETY